MFNKVFENKAFKFASKIGTGLVLCISISACSSIDRLANIGETPKLSAIESPTTKAGYKPVRLPMPQPVAHTYQANSLWRSGARAFFKDQRANRIGDILTVRVNINDEANIANTTTRSRANSEDANLTEIAGFQNLLKKILPKDANIANLVDADSQSSSTGSGTVDREEDLVTTIAAVVTQVLPNGNLVIEGRQEIRVNYEVRELIVAGVVRPEDITSANEITSDKIAEARISYGGRGQLTDVQQPRLGQQFLDIILPF